MAALLVPALMQPLGGADWRPARRLDRCLPRLSVEPGERRGRPRVPWDRSGTTRGRCDDMSDADGVCAYDALLDLLTRWWTY
ncbi:hypothetical protein ACWGDT_14120 [Streptomyces avermitilis]